MSCHVFVHIVVGELKQHSPPRHLTTAVRGETLPWYYFPLLHSVNQLLWELPPLVVVCRQHKGDSLACSIVGWGWTMHAASGGWGWIMHAIVVDGAGLYMQHWS